MQSHQQSKDPTQQARDDAKSMESMCTTWVQLGIYSEVHTKSAMTAYRKLVASGSPPRDARDFAREHCQKLRDEAESMVFGCEQGVVQGEFTEAQTKSAIAAYCDLVASGKLPRNGCDFAREHCRKLISDAKVADAEATDTLCESLASTWVDPVNALTQRLNAKWFTSHQKECGPPPRPRQKPRRQTFNEVLETDGAVTLHVREYLVKNGLIDQWTTTPAMSGKVSTVSIMPRTSFLGGCVLEIDTTSWYTRARLEKELDRLFRIHGKRA